MATLRVYLIIAWAALIAYTGFVIGRDGLTSLASTFFGDIAAGHWPGQFNLDFLLMLTLAALWTGWRNRWSVSGWVLAVLALNLGSVFLMAYLLVLLHREGGDPARVLLGERAKSTN